MKTKVLVVERHELMQRGIVEMFGSMESCELDGVLPSTAAALERLGRDRSVGTVLLNVQMNVLEPIAESIAALIGAGARVIAYGINFDPYLLRTAVEAGAAGAIASLWDSTQLEQLIARVAGGREEEVLFPGDFRAASLSPRQREVLELYAAGESAREVAARTGLSLSTVHDYLDRIRAKYIDLERPIESRVDFYRRAVEDGFLPSGASAGHHPPTAGETTEGPAHRA